MTTPTNADLVAIGQAIWEALFDIPFATADPSRTKGDFEVTSFVHIEGAWHGAVMLECSMALAMTLTSAMFQTGDEPGPDDIRDALGELANMLAGNVKALLPEPCAISLPAVAFGPDHHVSVVGTSPVATVAFTCAGERLFVTLFHQSVARAGA